MEGGVMFCNDVLSVMEIFGYEYTPDQWRLFIDSSKVSLQLVLLYSGKRFLFVSLAHAANIKESYENVSYFRER
jgi:hypothetical protein